MNDRKIIFRKTTGTYLIATFFVLLALFDLIGLVTGSRSGKGFLGIDLGFTMDEQEIDIMGWIGVFVQLYTGYHLFRLNPQGRIWGLILLWPYTISSGLFLVVFIISLFADLSPLGIGYVSIDFYDKPLKIVNPFFSFLIAFSFFIFYSFQIYFLMRKDIKMEFTPKEISKEVL